MEKGIKKAFFMGILIATVFTQVAYGGRSQYQNGILLIPRIDVDGNALELVFRAQMGSGFLFVLERVTETSLTVPNSGVYNPQQLTIYVDEIELGTGELYSAQLRLLSQFPRFTFSLGDVVHLNPQPDPAGSGDAVSDELDLAEAGELDSTGSLDNGNSDAGGDDAGDDSTDADNAGDGNSSNGTGFVELVSVSTATTQSSTFHIPVPNNLHEDDIMVLILGSGSGKPSQNQPGGWTRFEACLEQDNGQRECSPDSGNDLNGQAFYKVATANEPQQYFIESGSANGVTATIIALRGADTTNPIFSSTGLSYDGNADESHCPSTSGIRGGVLLCAWIHDDPQQLQPPSGMNLLSQLTVHGDAQNTASRVLTSDGQTGTIAAQHHGFTSGGNNDLALAMVIRPGYSDTSNQTDTGTKVAFIADTGVGGNFQEVLNLIKAEGAELTIVAGDTSYADSRDEDWDTMVRNTLGSQDPVLIAAGNHDYGDSDFSTVLALGLERIAQNLNVQCAGAYAEKMTCSYKNVYFVLSSIGSHGSISLHESYIENSLESAPVGMWRFCVWHKNQKDLQPGGKSNEVGWSAYETCRQHGAIIATAHEHSYSRSHLLSDMSRQTIVSTASDFELTEGRTFAFVSGLGGASIDDQKRDGDWWASIYTATQGATYGALFGTFYEDRAEFYFKNIAGQIIDQFTVRKGY